MIMFYILCAAIGMLFFMPKVGMVLFLFAFIWFFVGPLFKAQQDVQGQSPETVENIDADDSPLKGADPQRGRETAADFDEQAILLDEERKEDESLEQNAVHQSVAAEDSKSHDEDNFSWQDRLEAEYRS